MMKKVWLKVTILINQRRLGSRTSWGGPSGTPSLAAAPPSTLKLKR